MLLYPVIAILYNIKNETYHPIVYDRYPLSGLPDRYKSRMHHTEGFSERADAVESQLDTAKKIWEVHKTVPKFYNTDLYWDGEDIPAEVMLFSDDNLTDEPV
jgi:hypothetical protein